MSEKATTSSTSQSERITELEVLLQQAINERNEAWFQLEENDIEIRAVEIEEL